MSIAATPKGTYGRAKPSTAGIWKFIGWFLVRHARTKRSKESKIFRGVTILAMTTVGARSGLERTSPVGYFIEGQGWLVIATAAGAVDNPSWYYNIVANPDRVVIEIDGNRIPVEVEQLEGDARTVTLQQGLDRSGRSAASAYRRYVGSTDRVFPLLRLTPRG